MFDIENPKVYADRSGHTERRVFSYYAGYSQSFATNLLSSLSLEPHATVLDPWNGAGTTTTASALIGIHSIGQDMNPVMVLAAQSALITPEEITQLLQRAENIVQSAKNLGPTLISHEPLESWFHPESAQFVRRLENTLNCQAFDLGEYNNIFSRFGTTNIDKLTATLYVCLFNCVKKLLSEFVASNPTWVKIPHVEQRVDISEDTITLAFLNEVKNISIKLTEKIKVAHKAEPTIQLGNSESLNIPDESVDVVLTSPPYCTRIDYAVATRLELAILRTSVDQFDTLRRAMMGTSTVPRLKPSYDSNWGKTCDDFLVMLHDHASVASRTYYYKSHTQYFSSLYKSLAELARVMRTNGRCFLVVQDSFYKDLLNPVCQIVVEMCENLGLRLEQETAFIAAKSMSSLNPKAKKYRADRRTSEKVLCFLK